MKHYTHYLTFNTEQKREFINITHEVKDAVMKSKIQEGMILVAAMHLTAAVYINDDESGLISDIETWLEHLAPYKDNYHHHGTGETNGDAHLKNLLMHHQVIIPITKGMCDFGPWQQVFYAEFDGQRPKRIVLKAMGD